MRTERGLDRLVFFTDAVSAIAITLLILPLVDSAAAAAGHLSASQFIAANLNQLFGFVLSFAVIARLWAAHHSMFEHVSSYDRSLFVLSLFWALTIVFLPLPTEMLSQFETTPTTVAWYIGTMLLSSIALLLLAVTIRRHPEIARKDNPISGRAVFGVTANAVSFLLAFVVGVFIPEINFFALLLVFLATPATWLYDRAMARRTAPETGTGSRPETGTGSRPES
ncbi:DUF1211 domain-containing protein [Planctomonas sp. JC2975]|uniref:TMEM175 family protein n=1 Tax=Planctomonas sp. JC2975 TaxID=2729626 RepID=UPI001473ABDB|nr:TMEM175 family protein [Planctomonas sp. JC2975]NNC12452.1 DUF1211 domain-containing protein [Planctomonas sp. JC2975]